MKFILFILLLPTSCNMIFAQMPDIITITTEGTCNNPPSADISGTWVRYTGTVGLDVSAGGWTYANCACYDKMGDLTKVIWVLDAGSSYSLVGPSSITMGSGCASGVLSNMGTFGLMTNASSTCTYSDFTPQNFGELCTITFTPAFNGACCFSNGTCQIMNSDDCNNAGGSYQGDNTSCETLYADTDNDGYGDPNSPESSCSPRQGFVNNSDDCDDTTSNITAIGEPCDDGNPSTAGDFMNENCECVYTGAIPALSQWGLIILGLSLAICSTIALQRNYKSLFKHAQ